MPIEYVTLKFEGLDAINGRLDLYDASISNYGLARTIAIVGHYFQTGDIIAQAPRSSVRIYIYPPEDGSFKQTVAAAVVGGIIAAPFHIFVGRVIDDWFPNPDPQMEQVIELLKEQNKLRRLELDLPQDPTEQEVEQERVADEHIEQERNKIQVIRSITANSFKDIFRPIGRSVDYVSIYTGPTAKPVSAIDQNAVRLIASESRQPDIVNLVGVVNSFSRSSKSGILFSRARGIPFTGINSGRLPAQDDYSRSQYMRLPIELTGSYVLWFDGTVKRFLAEESRRLPEA